MARLRATYASASLSAGLALKGGIVPEGRRGAKLHDVEGVVYGPETCIRLGVQVRVAGEAPDGEVPEAKNEGVLACHVVLEHVALDVPPTPHNLTGGAHPILRRISTFGAEAVEPWQTLDIRNNIRGGGIDVRTGREGFYPNALWLLRKDFKIKV